MAKLNVPSRKIAVSTAKSADSIPIFTREACIKRQLRQHLKAFGFTKNKAEHLAPPELTKERLTAESRFVQEQWLRLKQYFADGAILGALLRELGLDDNVDRVE